MEKLYKYSEVAELLSVTRHTVERWAREGKLNVVRINGNPRVAESELKRLMKGE